MRYRFGDCELDSARFELHRAEQSIPIEPQVLELLLYLIEHRDRAVTRSELFENLWRGRVVGDAALNSRIKSARAAIGDDGTAQTQIRTLHRTGYRFVGSVEELAAPEAPLAARAVPTAPPPTPSPERRRGRLGLVGAAFGLALAVGAFALLPRVHDADLASSAASAARSTGAAAAAGGKTLAVMPFANLSADPEQEYFADGISIDLLNKLSQLPDVRVTGRTSSAYFKGRSDPPAAIGAQLGVRHLLTGSVRKAGERMRIAVELIEAPSGYQLWSESYDREIGDVFDVQDEIAARVATALQVKLGLGENAEMGMTRNVEAYDEFLRGAAAYSQQAPGSFTRAIEHMHRALALDPGFSRAWAYLYCIHLDGSFAVPGHAEDWPVKALEALAHARELTPHAPFVKILEARESMRLGQRLEAYDALETLPDGYWTGDRYLTKDVFLGRFLLSAGYASEAVASLERSRAGDPLSPVSAVYLALAYAMAGDPEAALAETDRAIALGSSNAALLGSAMLAALGTRDAVEIRKRVHARDHGTYDAVDEFMLRHLENPSAARAELRRLAAEPAPPDFIRTVLLTHWAAYFGDDELALEQLRTIAHGSVDEGLLWRPVLSDVRRLPGFKELVREEGLVDYWQAHGWPSFCSPTTSDDFECS